jgi:hypothetical protein
MSLKKFLKFLLGDKMTKKIKAIVTVEIKESDKNSPYIECKLENGSTIILKSNQLLFPISYDCGDETSKEGNLLVTC